MTICVREGMVDTGVPWLGAVPSAWRRVPFWTLFKRVKCTGFEEEQLLSVYRDHGVVPKASRDDNFNKPSDDLSLYQLVEPGDLAINKMKAWQGSVAISEYRGIVSPAYFVFKARHSENSRFLHYLFRSAQFTAGYLSISKGIRPNQWDLEPQEHSRMLVPLPPLPVQNIIAAFLDRETGKIDALVEVKRRLIDLLKEERQAVISHAVTKGLDPNARMKPSGVEWLGDVPEHWSVAAVKRHCVLLKDGTHLPPARVEDGVPLLSVRNLQDGEFAFRDDDSMISETDYEALAAAFVPREGDVLLAIIGATLGKSAIVGPDMGLFHIQRSLAIFRAAAGMLPDWLHFVFQSKGFQNLLWERVGFSAQPGIYLGTLGGFQIPVPPLVEQTEIVQRVRGEVQLTDRLVRAAMTAIDLLRERRAALISAAVTGKIDVREVVAADEVAA